MKMNPQTQQQQQPASDSYHGHGVDVDTDIPASEDSTRAQYGDVHEHVSRRARSSSSAHQPRRSLTAAALEAHSNGERSGRSHRREPDADTLAQVGARDTVRPRRRRRRSTGTALLPRIREEAPEQALRGEDVAARESKLKSVYFNPLTTEFGDPAGPTHRKIRPPAPAESRAPPVFVERILDEFGDLRAWYR